MEIVQSILTQNPCYTAGRKITVKGLMLHSVGCAQPSAEVFVKRWNSPSYSRACVHAFIDANTGKVYQCLPWNHRAWHSGGSANNTHIGVEMCEPYAIRYIGTSAKFTITNAAKEKAKEQATTAYNAAVELFAMLCDKYSLNPLNAIVSHYEGGKKSIASGHVDPEHLWTGLGLPYTMDGFRRDVLAAMGGTVPATEESEDNVQMDVLKKGSSGAQVKALQALLNGYGYTCGAVDGGFGAKTDAAVRKYQQANGLAVDGAVGKATWARLLGTE